MNAIQKTARMTGLLYLAIALLSIFGLTYVPATLIVAGDAAATANRIMAAESLFRLGFISNILTFTINIFVAILLYKLLAPVNKMLAALMVILILVGVGIAMLNELNQMAALLLLGGADYLTAFTTEQRQALAALFLTLREHGLMLGHLFFGLWLFPLGYLIIKSTFLPKWIGFLLLVAGAGYVVDFALFFLVPGITIKVSVFTFVGEVCLLLWLLIKGVNVERWQKRALAVA
ncbi:MAG: DUF4386 domain-containing protein [Caldilinea sp. CFX5]|nr:DUF4386 domain-containing protein [Caldilinea sp. CFX5]